MRPFSVAENEGFRILLHVLEPHYEAPSRAHFSQNVLQKQTTFDSHTSDNLSEILKGAVAEWRISRPYAPVPVTTDNARNIANAVIAARLSPHIRCCARTINLAAQKGMGVNQMSRLLDRVRKIVTFFHRSAAAAAVLKDKQKMLQLPSHKLVQDVATRWNQSHDMLERYLEQQAVFSALTDKSVKKNIKDIVTLSDIDVKLGGDVVQLLKPLKTVTLLMSTDQMPTISMVMPLKHRILASMKHSSSESETVKETKSAIATDFEDPYSDADRALIEFLHVSTALDPRFKSLPFLDEATNAAVFRSLTEGILDNCSHPVQAQTSREETDKEIASSSSASDGPPRAKKAQIAELFRDLFPTTSSSKPFPQVVEEEVQHYKSVQSLPVESNPLV
ncbi:E3 SUMO-protein ligase ZBED1 [Cyprinodon tularosa]|uniref:E3 SUMO-protein ligase ZBED1 n=1 Tax=Cyprinodon tularosa TaxID=77115 RepID=UPI0018E27955|nr:E3 SUMO-protein ligase ZBED1 [Cyprinodon tularosa]